jgi:hypothetical protein
LFFEKKQQKTFDHFGFGLSGLAEAELRKSFFGSFFQKRTAFRHWPLHGRFNVPPAWAVTKEHAVF